jgi:hypothetical protein
LGWLRHFTPKLHYLKNASYTGVKAMMKILLALFMLALPSSILACVQMELSVDWDRADKIYIGKVISGKLVDRKKSEYVEFRTEVSHKLKGVDVRSVEKSVSWPSFPVLTIGNTYIIFEQKNGFIDYCGSTQIFDNVWIDSKAVITESEPEKLIEMVRSIVENSP